MSLGPTPLSGANQVVANLAPILPVAGTCWVMNNWDAEGGLDVVERLGATILAADPAVLAAALRQARARPGGLPASLRAVLCGDGPVPPETRQAWHDELGIPLAEVPPPETTDRPPAAR